MIWWKRDPELLKSFENELLRFPKLKMLKIGDAIAIQGEWDVFGKDKFIRSFEIRISIPDDFPLDVPLVYETTGDIPKNANRHVNPDSTMCLFSPPERWEKWPSGSGIGSFLEGPVKEFFFSQAYFEMTGKWPFGDWSHGDAGIIEYYLSRLKVKTRRQLNGFLEFLPYDSVSRQWKCPCGKLNRFRACHWKTFSELRQVIPMEEWDHLRKILGSRI